MQLKKGLMRLLNFILKRKLSNVATAENYIKGLTSTDKKVYDKTIQKYKDNIKKIKDTKPLNERMAEARAKEEEDKAGIKQYRKTKGVEYRKTKGNELRARDKAKTYFIQFMLYTASEESKDTKMKDTKIKSKPACKTQTNEFLHKNS